MILTLLAWASTAAILFTYAVMSAFRHPAETPGVLSTWTFRFHLANALGFAPLALLNATLHAWPAVVVNLGFGLPACWAVLREISRRKHVRRYFQTPEKYGDDSWDVS